MLRRTFRFLAQAKYKNITLRVQQKFLGPKIVLHQSLEEPVG